MKRDLWGRDRGNPGYESLNQCLSLSALVDAVTVTQPLFLLTFARIGESEAGEDHMQALIELPGSQYQ